jgi:putative Mn2+ efflux pump MntP
MDVSMRRQRPPARDVTTVFVFGVVGTLVPVVGWLIGITLVLRASSWSAAEKAAAAIGPVVGLLAVVALIARATGTDLRLPLLAAVPLTTSLSSAAGAVYLALRLVAHQRAAEAGHR